MPKVDWQDFGEGDAHSLQRDAHNRRAHVLYGGAGVDGARWWLDRCSVHPPANQPSTLTTEEAKVEAEQALLGLRCPDSGELIPAVPADPLAQVMHASGLVAPRDLAAEHERVPAQHDAPNSRDFLPNPTFTATGAGECGPCLQTQCPGGECGLPDISLPREVVSPRQTLVRRLASTAPTQVQAELGARADRVDGYYDALRQLAEAETVPPELLEQMQREAAAFARDVGDAALEVRRDLLLQQDLEKAILDHYQAQADAARRRFKAIEASVERIEEQVLRIVCERAGTGDTRALALTTAKVGIWKNTPAVALDDDLDARLLPERFQRVTVEVDKKAIGAALKAGEKVPGCSLVQRDRVEVR